MDRRTADIAADRDHVARLVAAAREQGLPEQIADPPTLRLIATLLKGVHHDRQAA